MSENSSQFKAQQDLVCTLTEDLTLMTLIKKQYPGLYEIVTSDKYLNQKCSSFRRKWLGNMEVDKILTILIEFWKSNIAIIIPDPSKAYGCHYSEQVKLLLAVKELNSKAYNEIIRKWKISQKVQKSLEGCERSWLALLRMEKQLNGGLSPYCLKGK